MIIKVIFCAVLLGLTAAYPSDKPYRALPSEHNGSKLGIYHGKSTTIEKHPYLAVLLVDQEFMCAGVILSDSWVITDADCFYGYTKTDLTILSGSNDGESGTSHKVKKIVTHPNYQYGTYYYSYGLLQIKGSFTWSSQVANISLPSKRLAANTQTVIAGYGDTEYEDGALMQGNMKLLANATCAKYFEDIIDWHESEACAYNKGKTTMCQGDFGDPFVHKGVLYGVAVGGLRDGFCTSEATPTVMADIYLVVDWIKKYTGAQIA